MPRLQWLGAVPRDDSWSYIARALGAGAEEYSKRREEEREYELLKERYKLELQRIEDEKKWKLVSTINKLLSAIADPTLKEQYISLPQVQALYEDVGITPPKKFGEPTTTTINVINKLEKMVPLWDRLLPGTWSPEAKKLRELRKRIFSPPQTEEKVIFGTRYKRGIDGKWHRVD
ncbi:MAG: hypothetical protein DRH51_08550 [Candidatus Coatesbacteria bacterium]|nr:MAG: hypothetical protein DRH51_08550 [Candidatus Coatesbacteria bacterium]